MAKLKKQLTEELQNIKVKLFAHKVGLALMSVVLLVGVVSIATAFSSEKAPQNVFENVGSVNIAAPVETPAPPQEDQVFGSVTSPFFNGPEFGVGKDWKFSVSAPLADATSTWSFPTPFLKATSTASDIVIDQVTSAWGYTGATTTVELVRVNFTSSTPSAYEIGCGSSSNKFATSTSSYTSLAILTGGSIGAARGNVTLENDLQTTEGADVNGGTVEKIMIGPSQPYIVCKVSTAATGEWTGADGVSPGNIVIRFSKVQ